MAYLRASKPSLSKLPGRLSQLYKAELEKDF